MGDAKGLSCAELVELVTDYVEGALTHDERERMEEHLRVCEGCRIHLDQMRRTIELTGGLQPENVPPEAAAALLAAFRDWKLGTA
jgi:anti-sigma factor RsiW